MAMRAHLLARPEPEAGGNGRRAATAGRTYAQREKADRALEGRGMGISPWGLVVCSCLPCGVEEVRSPRRHGWLLVVVGVEIRERHGASLAAFGLDLTIGGCVPCSALSATVKSARERAGHVVSTSLCEHAWL